MRIVILGNFRVDYSTESHHKKTLESLGHEVVALQESETRTNRIILESRNADVFVWIHTHGWRTQGVNMSSVLTQLRRSGIPTLSYHLDLWNGLTRQRDLKITPVYTSIEHFFTVDKYMADYFNTHTRVKGHYLQAGVLKDECYLLNTEQTHDVIFVGSKQYHKEWAYRPKLINWLEETYPTFIRFNRDTEQGIVRGHALNQLYASTKIVIGDSLCIGYNYDGYWSDRVYETIGRGGFIIHPFIEGMQAHFEDKKHLVYYKFNDFDDLRAKIDYYLTHDNEREAIRRAGFEHVRDNHTYTNRWQKILQEIKP